MHRFSFHSMSCYNNGQISDFACVDSDLNHGLSLSCETKTLGIKPRDFYSLGGTMYTTVDKETISPSN